MLDQRSFEILQEIVAYPRITKIEVMRKMAISERQLLYDIDKINIFLQQYDLPVIEMEQQSFHVPKMIEEMTVSGLAFDVDLTSFILAEEERVFIIYLYTYIRQEIISAYHFQILLGVSKNTVLSDIKKVKALSSKWNVTWQYTRANGYHLIGDELNQRRLAAYCTDTLLAKPLGREIMILILKSWKKETYLEETRRIVDAVLLKANMNYVKSRKNEMIFRLSLLQARQTKQRIEWKAHEKELIERQSAYKIGQQLAEKLYDETAGDETHFIALQLIILLQEVHEEENPSLKVLAEQIIEEFEKVTLLPLENKAFLTKSLYDHLVPAFFRISFNMPLINPLNERIKDEYHHLYGFVERALAPLSMWTGQKISEDEIGYFTIHFGGHLSNETKQTSEKLTGVIICSNGISSSIMLKAQMNQMFPEIEMLHIHTLEDLKDIPTMSYDMIFSTVDRNFIGKPYYAVKPLLSQVEKNYLMQQVAEDFPALKKVDVSVVQMMEIIRKHATIHHEKQLFSDLVNMIYFHNNEQGRYLPMLSELLTADMIQFAEEDLQWEAAIEKAAEPLVSLHKVETEYVETMINNVNEMGPYIHIGKGIAIPHARPENGVNEIGMSLLRTKKAVALLGQAEHEIDIFIVIAAIDSEAHLKALSSLTKILSDDDMLTKLKNASTADELIQIIKKGEDDK